MRAISHENASSIDSWISQARQLHADIESSKGQADEILKLGAEDQVDIAHLPSPFLIPSIQPQAHALTEVERLLRKL